MSPEKNSIYGLIEDITSGVLHSARIVAPLDVGLRTLKQERYEPISLEEQARLRVQEGGPDSSVSDLSNVVRQGVLYMPDGKIVLTKRNPILENVEDAMEAYRTGGRFYVTDEQAERAMEDSVDLRGRNIIPTINLAEDSRTASIFGKNARSYGDFLFYKEVYGMPILLAQTEDRPFVNLVWFSNLGKNSAIDGTGAHLDKNSYHLRGVRDGHGRVTVPSAEELLDLVYGPDAGKIRELRMRLRKAIVKEDYEIAARLTKELESLGYRQ